MRKNNKGKVAGSGTCSKARRERVQKAAQERDRLAAAGDPDAIAKKALADEKKQAAQAKKEAAAAAAAPSDQAPPCPKEEPASASQGAVLGASASQLVKEAGQLKWRKVEKKGWEMVDKTTPAPAKVDKTTPAPKVDKTTPAKVDKTKADKGKAAKVDKTKAKTKPPGHVSLSSSPDWGDSSSSRFGDLGKRSGDSSSSSNPGDLAKRSRSQTPENMKISEEFKLEKKKNTPLAKGHAQKKKPLAKGIPVQLQMKNSRKIAVDWHGVLVINDVYDPSNNRWLQCLADLGYEVHLLSFCGIRRAREVHSWAWEEWQGWASVSFTWEKEGKDGKAEWRKKWDVCKMIDDNPGICLECIQEGIKAYPICSLATLRGYKFKQAQKLSACFSTFQAAVTDILLEEASDP